LVRPLGVAFDLDDTLYLERDYVRSGFRAVAEDAAAGTAVAAEDAFGFLWAQFLAGARGTTFDDLLVHYPELAARRSVADLVARYREHAPTIDYLPGAEALLGELRTLGVPLAVISDGPLVSQRAKAEALGVGRYANPVILTDLWGAAFWKPHARAFEAVGEAFALPPERLVYVGDNPLKDFHAPRALGWRSVRLRLPDQVREALPHDDAPPTLEVTSVAALREGLLALL
jgi:putative hydrolase of the HAD superfamily